MTKIWKFTFLLLGVAELLGLNIHNRIWRTKLSWFKLKWLQCILKLLVKVIQKQTYFFVCLSTYARNHYTISGIKNVCSQGNCNLLHTQLLCVKVLSYLYTSDYNCVLLFLLINYLINRFKMFYIYLVCFSTCWIVESNLDCRV